MADKKYYWFKFKENFFDQHEIKVLEKYSKESVLLYIKLLSESVKHEGKLRFSDHIPYSVEDLAAITNTDIEIVKKSVDLFKKYKLMEVDKEGTFRMSQMDEIIGCETKEAERKREYRAKQKATKFNDFEQRDNTDLLDKLIAKATLN